MSSVVTAPEGTPSRPSPTTTLARPPARALSGDFLFGVIGTVALALVAFAAGGGINLAPNTWVEGGLIVLGAAAAISVVLLSGSGRAWGAATMILFAALAALTYGSIAWSVQPATSWLEANRTLSYLAAFGTALVLARLAPGRWRSLLGAVAAAATVVCAYALLVKVFPATFDPTDPLGRLRAPFDYWNATGLMAALGIPACLWAGARRERATVLRSLSVPALAILIPVLLLAYSRGALVVAVIGSALWFTLAPLRLRSALILALGVAGGAAISAWALATRGISADRIPLASRTSAGHNFGVVIIVVLLLTAIAGFAATFALDRVTLPMRVRRRIGYVLIGLVALVPVAGVAALSGSSRGLTGEVSHVWNALTNPNGVVGDKPGRLVNLSNSRPHYWSLGLKVGEHHLLAGVGALGFATAEAAYPSGGVWDTFHAHVGHAHSYLVETFADFGLVGLAISLALLVAWALATRRTFELTWPRRATPAPRPPPANMSDENAAERTGMVALLAIAVTFGYHSLIDWTWFIPGVAVPALVCAGWLAGRGPVSQPARRLARRRALTRSPAAATAVVSIIVVALLALWVVAQPLRSSDAYSSAITAAIHGDTRTALTDARSAAVEDPVSIDPLFLLAQIYTGFGDGPAAHHELSDAVSRQPFNPRTWEQLGCYDLAGHRTAAAETELHRALSLEPAQTQLSADPAAYCAGLGG